MGWELHRLQLRAAAAPAVVVDGVDEFLHVLAAIDLLVGEVDAAEVGADLEAVVPGDVHLESVEELILHYEEVGA